MEQLKRLQHLSLVSKVTAELENHLNIADKTLAEFVIELAKEQANVGKRIATYSSTDQNPTSQAQAGNKQIKLFRAIGDILVLLAVFQFCKQCMMLGGVHRTRNAQQRAGCVQASGANHEQVHGQVRTNTAIPCRACMMVWCVGCRALVVHQLSGAALVVALQHDLVLLPCIPSSHSLYFTHALPSLTLPHPLSTSAGIPLTCLGLPALQVLTTQECMREVMAIDPRWLVELTSRFVKPAHLAAGICKPYKVKCSSQSSALG